jgi:hypothetical protein
MTDDTLQTTTDRWDDLRDRLERALAALVQLADDAQEFNEARRLDAKASGVALALSYMRDSDIDQPNPRLEAIFNVLRRASDGGSIISTGDLGVVAASVLDAIEEADKGLTP